ncbi:MAG: cysteine desulfurase [Chitinophagaceae bacterium]|nr:cysteine desulfurase [Chitinophagaceae bacterium]
MRIYFDNAATTQMDREVIDAMIPFMESHFGNPSAIHFFGRETRAAIERARKTVAKCLHATPSEIFFTSGGTESNNMAIRCGVQAYQIKHIITSPIEHHCVMHTTEALEKKGLVNLHYVKVDEKGRFDLVHLEQLLAEIGERCLVTLMHANNEIGTMMDINEVGTICKKYNALFHCDTVQTVAHFPFDLEKTPVDFISGAAHKFHGPKGTGFLYIHHSIKIPPLIFGGAQERNMRAGTENVYGIVGLAKALETGYEHFEETREQITEVRSYMKESLKSNLPDVVFNGDVDGNCLYTVLNVSFPMNNKSQLLLFNLDMAGICASSGSACSSGSNENSHVLEAIHADSNRVAIRFSFSKNNTKDEVDFVIAKLKELVGEPVTV